MKVSISTTIEVSEEQREQLARSLDGQGARKRKATRAEFKDFIWTHGAGWESALVAEGLRADGVSPDPVPAPVAVDEPEAEEDDLLGLLGTADAQGGDGDDPDGLDLI